MSGQAWAVFAAFWVVFVTTPGPNAANCIAVGMAHGLPRALWAVAGILTQAALFLTLSAIGIAAALAAAPTLFAALKLIGAAVLVALGVRTVLRAARPLPAGQGGGSIYGRAVLIATVNAKSLAGYLAAFTQFVQPGVPIGPQMWAIVPTALSLTALSYTTYTALGAWLGRRAEGVLLDVWVRRALGVCFVVYGALLGVSGLRA